MYAYLIIPGIDCAVCKLKPDGTCTSHCARILITASVLKKLKKSELLYQARNRGYNGLDETVDGLTEWLLEKHNGTRLYRGMTHLVHPDGDSKFAAYVIIASEKRAACHYSIDLTEYPEALGTLTEYGEDFYLRACERIDSLCR